MYVVLIQDRHTDTDAEVWQTRDKAITRADELAKEYSRNPEDIQNLRLPGCVHFIRYSCEGDSICVLERNPQ